ncbi:MAG: DNA primase [Candidatus Vogelbacteria bacterium]|nr:DNA primase [Candidatus Vogelbacteria bacterium]
MAGTIEQIKSRLNIVDVVGSYIKLDRAGGNFKARCPFHNEKTPSFFVSPERDTFHCFGCSKGGDIITFVQEMEGIEFPDALRILAERAGVEIGYEDKTAKSEKGRLIAAVSAASLFYQEELAKNLSAKGYLRDRGLTDETIANWKIGFAPDSWRSLYSYLKAKRFTDDEIEKAGLSIKTDRGYYDRFRSRIMFPISNISGVTIAFTGRIFRLGEGTDKEEAKYVNSPQTLLYDKSRVLYGFDRARIAMREADACILVEGQVDLIMVHQAGNRNAVAVSGTALTEEHLVAIKRLASKLILAFDGDGAGFKAATRGINMALRLGFDVQLVGLPNQMDPADLILKDSNGWSSRIKEAKHIIDFYLDIIREKEKDPRKIILEVGKDVLPFIKSLPTKMEQALFVGKVSRLTNIPEVSVWNDLNKIDTPRSDGVAEATSLDPPVGKTKHRSEMIFEKLIGIIFWQIAHEKSQIDHECVSRKLEGILGEETSKIMRTNAELEKDKLIFEAEIAYAGDENIDKAVSTILLDLEEEILREKLGCAAMDLKELEALGRHDEVEKCLKVCQTISDKLTRVKQSKLK